MAENSFLRSVLLVVFASLASLSAEAWLRAGENPPSAATVPPVDGSYQPLFEDDVELALPDETVGAVTADLQDRLEKDLRARRPVEFQFIAKVIELVEDDVLPLSLVNRCYLWARRQSNFPFQHFENAVRREARRIGIVIVL